MSIATAIQNAQQKVSNAYTALSNKGATLPVTQDLSNMPATINTITTLNGTTLSVTPSTSAQSFTPTSPYNAFINVSVGAVTYNIDPNIIASNIKSGVSILGVTGNVIELKGETKTINPSTSTQIITPSEGKNGITSATVNPVTSAIDANIQAGNIKKNVQILGVTGTFEGGITPTGTISISNNGNYDVTNYANATVNVSGGASQIFNCPIEGWGMGVSVNGDLSYRSCDNDIVFTGVKRILNAYHMSCAFSSQGGTPHKFIFPDLTYIITAERGFARTWREASSASEIMFTKLVSIDGNYCFESAFSAAGSNNATGVFFPELTTLNGTYVFSAAWEFNSKFPKVVFNKLSNLTNARYAFSNAFRYLSYNGFELYFYALKSSSFGSYTDFFNNMFLNTTRGTATVHFPPSIQNTVGTWSSVTGGYGASGRVTTLFDLGGTVTFNIIGQSPEAYVYDEKVENNTVMVDAGDTQYIISDPPANTLLVSKVQNVEVGDTKTINEDLTTGYNTIKLSCGVSGLGGFVAYKGIVVPALADGNGNYILKSFIESGTSTVRCVIDGGENYRIGYDSITATGGDITRNITLQSATWGTFTRPNLTSNGELGGPSFAVTASSIYSTTYNVFRAFDSSTATTQYWRPLDSETNPKLTFYNPTSLKLATLGFRWASTTYRATNVVVEGSNDNYNWTQIGSYSIGSTSPATVNINNTTSYMFFRLTFTKYGTSLMLADLTITGQTKS